ncbi:MAG: hypothetical protein AB7O62_21830 [Pirellulales bacterium]
MKKSAGPPNPFYVLLVIVGIAFSMTACAYGVMAVRAVKAGTAVEVSPDNRLIQFLDQHGAKLMAGEIAALAVATVAAMVSDGWWARRSEKSADSSPRGE